MKSSRAKTIQLSNDFGAGDFDSSGAVTSAMYPLVMAPFTATTRGLRQPDPLLKLDRIKVDLVTTRAPNKHQAKGVEFLPDSGANMTTISLSMMRSMGMTVRDLGCTNPPPPVPRMADGTRARFGPIGIFRGTRRFREKTVDTDVYVMEGIHHPLLSR